MRTKLTSRLSLLFLSFALVLALPAMALADTLEDNLAGSTQNQTIKQNQDVTVKYWINNTGDACDVSSTQKATFAIDKPAAVSASATTLEFTQCGSESKNFQTVTYTSGTVNTSGNGYAISWNRTNGPVTSVGNANFNLKVEADTTAPTVTGVAPTEGATDVAVGTNVEATFSEKMDANTIGGSTFTLKKQGESSGLSGTVSYDATAKKATLDPSADLDHGTTYDAVVTTGAKDLAGNALDQDGTAGNQNSKTWSFRTAKQPTNITDVSGSGTYGGNATLKATLKTAAGGALSGKTVDFKLNGNSVGSATTDASGVATRSVSLSGIDAGTYPNHVSATFAGDTSNNGSNGSGDLKVNKATPTVNWSNPSDITYGTQLGGTQLNAQAKGVDGGNLAGSYAYTPASGTKLNAGAGQNLKVDFTPADTTNYNAASKTVQINVEKADQAITFAQPADKTFGDPDFNAGATADSGLAVSFEAQGNCSVSENGVVSITGAGSCAITASQAGNANYNAATPVERTFNIEKAEAQVSLSGLNQTYNGEPREASATTVPANLSVDFTYDGGSQAPTNAGSYKVVGTVNDNNYKGSSEGTLVIEKAEAQVSLSGLSHTYDGSIKSATASTTPANLKVDLSYSRNGIAATPKNAGSYAVEAKVDEANYRGSAEGTLVIEKAEATINLSGLSHTYDGSAKAATVTTDPDVPNKQLTVTYDGSQQAPTNAGSYSVVASLNDANYRANDAMGTLVIEKADQAITFAQPADKTFGDPDFNAGATADSGLAVSFEAQGNCSVSENGVVSITGAGSCAITASQAGNANYNAATPVERTFNIEKKATEITLNANSLSQVYDGTAKAARATTPEGLNVDVAHYNFGADGQPDLSQKVNPLNAGSYHVVASLQHPNYRAQDVSGKLVIEKATATISLGNLNGHTYDGTAKSAAASTTPAGLRVDLTYDGTSQAPTNAGSYRVDATVVDANYKGSANGTLTIGKAEAQVQLGSLSHVWDGTAKSAAASTTPAGLRVDLTYDGTSQAPTNAGSYRVDATVVDANYKGNVTGTLTIGAWTYKGFYAPIDMKIWNTVKAGSTVPMKFELFKGTTELKDVSDIKSYGHRSVGCDMTSGADAIETTTTGSTSLRFDTTSDQFIFNWKTGSTWAVNSCYEVTVTAQDGSKLSAYFKMK